MAQKHRSAPPFHLGDGYEVSDLRFSDPKTHFRRELAHTSKERMLARKAKKDLDRPGWASPLNLPAFDQTLFVQSHFYCCPRFNHVYATRSPYKPYRTGFGELLDS